MNLKDFFVKNKETLQLIYGVILIILIPLLIVYNTIFIINKYNKSLDVSLQRQALTVGRSIYALLKNDLSNNDLMQKKISSLAESNPNFQELEILKPENNIFKIIASSRESNLNKEMSFYYYELAWAQPDNDGLATDSLKLASSPETEELIKNFNPNDRFWLVAMPMEDENGEKQALLSIKLSSKIVDDLTKDTRNASVFFLVVTVLIAILFLSATVRLWDYALLYKKIREVDQMKDEFISIASHELRTPVTSIKGYVSMMQEGTYGTISSKIQDTLRIVRGSTERLGRLVEDLLNVSRIEQGRLKVETKSTDIATINKEIIIELTEQAKEKNLKLEYKPHTDKLPLINIDGERFKQVLINLIGNAIKYTEKGKVEVLTEIKNNKYLEIKIKDTGIGMSAKDRKRLFEKFYRVQNEKTKDVIGTGLGLWITKQIVELMHGNISIDSIENVGTQVSLQFPIKK